MYVKTITKFENDRLDGDSTLAIALRIDLDEIVQEAGDRLWDHVDAEDAAEFYGVDILDHLNDDEVLDGFSVDEKLKNVAVEEVVSWLEGEGYTVTQDDGTWVQVSKSTIETMRTILNTARDLLAECD